MSGRHSLVPALTGPDSRPAPPHSGFLSVSSGVCGTRPARQGETGRDRGGHYTLHTSHFTLHTSLSSQCQCSLRRNRHFNIFIAADWCPVQPWYEIVRLRHSTLATRVPTWQCGSGLWGGSVARGERAGSSPVRQAWRLARANMTQVG